MRSPREEARRLRDAERDAADSIPQLRTMTVTQAISTASSGPLDVTAPGRAAAISSVPPVVGLSPVGMVRGTQALVRDGPMPTRLGRSPWQVGNLS